MDGGEVAHDEGGILALETQAVVGSLWKLSRRAALDLFEKPSVWEVSCIVKKKRGIIIISWEVRCGVANHGERMPVSM